MVIPITAYQCASCPYRSFDREVVARHVDRLADQTKPLAYQIGESLFVVDDCNPGLSVRVNKMGRDRDHRNMYMVGVLEDGHGWRKGDVIGGESGIDGLSGYGEHELSRERPIIRTFS